MRPTRTSPVRSSTTAKRLLAGVAALALALGALPARAARPLPDSGKWDRAFALYARDVAVPWKRIVVRLDTYSGAPVDFAAYEVDPAQVIVAGTPRSRAVDTARRTPVARWRFTPPPGQRYTPNEVDVPLQNREGFFVIEARRGDAVQQTWLDLTRVGLLSKESAGGIVLYGADLGTGKALRGMRVTALSGTQFTYAKTDAHGIVRWTAAQRPRFAMAEWGRSRSFLSFLPQAPVPAAVVGVRTDRAVFRAGERVRVVGFARKRGGTAYRPAAGEARLTIVARGQTLASSTARLDAAGAFAADLTLPRTAPAGDAAVLATAAGASGGAAIHVDALGDVALAIEPSCTAACPPDQPIALAVTARRADGAGVPNRDVRLRVVRSPHVLPPGQTEDVPRWATTAIVDAHARTDENGAAAFRLPAPTDGLASTYGITASSGGATASARIAAPTARVALEVTPDRRQIDIGEAAAFAVRGFDAVDGRPASGLPVKMRVVHGPSVQEQQLVLDADGRAHAVFRNVVPGTNLAYAQAEVDGKSALDVDAVVVQPQALIGERSRSGGEIRIATDKPRYRSGDRIAVSASLAGASGDAFVTLEGTRALGEQTIAATDGRALARFTIPETVGDADAGVAFVRDGAMEYATARVAVDGPGHARATALRADQGSYAPGATARVTIADGEERAAATVAIRVADQPASSGAAFVDAPNVLAATGTTTQDPASPDPAWHASVVPERSTALDYAANGRRAPQGERFGAASGRALSWRIDRGAHGAFEIALPQQPGRYVVSVLKISDDGDVGAASLALEVK